MPIIVEPLPHDLAVINALKTIGRAVGYADAPPGALDAVRANPPGPGYMVLFPVDGGNLTGTMATPYADAELVYQVTVVARKPDEVQWLVGKILPAVRGMTVPGRVVHHVEPPAPGIVLPDRDVSPPVFYGTPRFRVFTTPA